MTLHDSRSDDDDDGMLAEEDEDEDEEEDEAAASLLSCMSEKRSWTALGIMPASALPRASSALSFD